MLRLYIDITYAILHMLVLTYYNSFPTVLKLIHAFMGTRLLPYMGILEGTILVAVTIPYMVIGIVPANVTWRTRVKTMIIPVTRLSKL